MKQNTARGRKSQNSISGKKTFEDAQLFFSQPFSWSIICFELRLLTLRAICFENTQDPVPQAALFNMLSYATLLN